MPAAPLKLMWRAGARQVRRGTFCLIVILGPILFFMYLSGAHYYAKSNNIKSQDNLVVAKTSKTSMSFIPEAQVGDVEPRAKPGCMIPSLILEDPDITKFTKKLPPVSCGDGYDWTVLSNGKFIITDEASKKLKDIKCNLTSLRKTTDFQTVTGEVYVNVKHMTDIKHDFFIVECTAEGGAKYKNYQAGVHPKPEVLQRKSRPKSDTNLDLDVIMIGQDSLSRMSWLRHLPLTRKYLVETLGAIEMEGHTVTGDGTPATMFPMLTSKREEELPEARRGYNGASTVDGFPWIWDDFRKAGYVTSWQEDQPQLGTFHYRLKGFDGEPVDHYYRPFGVYSGKRHNEFKDSCMGSTPRHVVENNYMKDVFDVYKGHRRWTFTFKSENSHEDNNHASRIDEHMRNHIKDLHDAGHLDNALLIVMSDHGARFSKIRAFAQGKQEERMPYFAMRLPESFREKYPEIIKNLKINSRRLTTPFDVHETFHEILNYTGAGNADISKRGVSLFKEIPNERDCQSAGIDPHWCFCMDWSPVPTESDEVNMALNEVMTLINGATEPYRDKCVKLTVKTVKSVLQMKIKDAVLKLKDTNDGGRGRFGIMSDKTQESRVVYQITFVTTPGNGLYETTVTRDLKTKVFSASLKTVSRINKYGKAPWCIMETIPQIRPYCLCNQPPPA